MPYTAGTMHGDGEKRYDGGGVVLISRKAISRLTMLACVVILAGCGGAAERKASYLARGEALMQQRNWEKARLEFRNALQIDPKDTRAQYLAATAAEKAGEFREAASFYNSAMADKSQVAARAGLAKLMLFSGANAQATKLVEDGLVEAPQNPDLIALRGALRVRSGDLAGARQDAETAVAAAPANEDAAALLASIESREGHQDKAIAVIVKALTAQPTNVDLRVILAQLQLNAGKRDEAEKTLQDLIKQEPAELVHRYRLAQFYVLNDNIDSAEATLRAAVGIAPSTVEPKLALANLISSRRSFTQGEASLKALVDSDRKDLPLQIGLGKFYIAHNRTAEAEAVYREVIRADALGPRGLEARNLLAAVLLRTGRAEEGRTLVDEVLKESPRDNEALVMRANIALGRGDAPGAIADLRAVLRDQPGSQPLLRALSQAYEINGDATLAEETLRSAVQASPRNLESRMALAQYLIKAERPDEAQPVVDQLVADQPGDIPSLEAAFRVQIARRDLPGARRGAEAIRSIKPELATGHYLLGLVDEADGKLEAARKNLDEAIRLAPDSSEPLTAAMRVDLALKAPERALARLDGLVTRFPQNAAIRELRRNSSARSGAGTIRSPRATRRSGSRRSGFSRTARWR